MMSPELSWLSATAILFFVYILGEVVAGNRQYSPKELLGPRDNLPAYGPAMGRAKRATANMVEAMCMFVPLVLVAVISERTNQWTALGCAVFFFARLAFAPLYWFGVPVLRTLTFFAGVAGLIMIFLQILPFSGV
ncbi:MAG: hypothetical protein B7X53_11090 [Hyphomonas sp. 34-62-18]|nr:MAG: hypothetical protein B7X53_11090 [Hyphomonas sp. 34-62-18]